MYRKPNRFMTCFVKITGLPVALLLFKPKVTYVSEKKLPDSAILMSNHVALLDMALYILIFPLRRIRFLVAEVMFAKGKLFAWFLCAIGAIRVNREAYEFGFIAESVEVLEHGKEILGIFPEARLPINGKPFPFTPSVAVIALQSGAPIVPVYTDGNYGLFKRTHVVVGEAVYLRELCTTNNPDKEEFKELTMKLHDVTYALKDHIK